MTRLTNRQRYGVQYGKLPRMPQPLHPDMLEKLKDAIRQAGRNEIGHWAHTKVVSLILGKSRTTTYRWLCDAASRGQIKSEEHYGWRYSKYVLSRRWRCY